ncbi:hypothetical protein M4I32_13780 [Microbacterium sp. LRZ72]|uniref:hypothetical protein n=1 Tax=Microbacterium sp. LRZ72 TaxID=2942481 RepID=UPI0029B930F9|nr:hypothetical protein [Microbacterium sp. LRZ72]MDX2377867.1 hypothetical protein [Microbacterium sp. LRZ72]
MTNAAVSGKYHRLSGGAYVITASRRDAMTGNYTTKRAAESEITRNASGSITVRRSADAADATP